MADVFPWHCTLKRMVGACYRTVESGMCDAGNVDNRVGTARNGHLLFDRQAEMSSPRLVCTLGVLLSGSLLQAPGELSGSRGEVTREQEVRPLLPAPDELTRQRR